MMALTKKEMEFAWMTSTHMMHLKKLRMAKSIINSLPLRKSVSISFSQKTKKDQIQEERFTEIEKSNRILLEKMSNIYANKIQALPYRTTPQQRRSLNKHQRKVQLSKISFENGVYSYIGTCH